MAPSASNSGGTEVRKGSPAVCRASSAQAIGLAAILTGTYSAEHRAAGLPKACGSPREEERAFAPSSQRPRQEQHSVEFVDDDELGNA